METYTFEASNQTCLPLPFSRAPAPVPPTTHNGSILGWYEHTVAVALARGDFPAFHTPAAQRSRDSEQAIDLTDVTTASRAPAPYRCPLCQVPGPYFLAVEPALRASFKAAKSKSKLKFRLLGARTILGGGGPASGGVQVDHVDGGTHSNGTNGNPPGVGYPSMVELRAAVRTQLALAAAVSALEGEGKGDRGEAAATECGGERASAAVGRVRSRSRSAEERRRRRMERRAARSSEGVVGRMHQAWR